MVDFKYKYYLQNNHKELELYFIKNIVLDNITYFQQHILELSSFKIKKVVINLLQITNIDSSGAIFLNDLKKSLINKSIEVSFTCNNVEILNNLSRINLQIKKLTLSQLQIQKISFLEMLGKDIIQRYQTVLSFLSFLGEISYAFLYSLIHFKHIRYKEIIFEINENIIKAFSIIAVASFLVGLVVAYQSSIQLTKYGANIFIVDMLGLSILRELAPLITAIIIAGRSGSSFTAQIGAMKVTQELDAMKTMGFDPIRFLVMPKIIAMVIMMPLLIFIADIAGLFGGMIVAQHQLGISMSFFIQRFIEVISIKQFFIGIIKGPFFAFLIASIAIFRGLNVQNDTQSIGINTTKSVVESIFAIIVCDAIFSIIFTILGM